MLNKTNDFLTSGPVGLSGASVMVVGCIGWIGNPFYVSMLEGLNIPESIGVGILPSYSTAVLCAFYGAAVFNQNYRYATTWTGIRKNFRRGTCILKHLHSFF